MKAVIFGAFMKAILLDSAALSGRTAFFLVYFRQCDVRPARSA